MRIGPFDLTFRRKALPPMRPLSPSSGGWWPIVRESYTGAWQRDVDLHPDTALSYFAVYACNRLISTDVAKLGLHLVQQDSNGIWTQTTSPAFSPVLRKPNGYQHIRKFIEQWILSKLIHGNAYVLKQRDRRNVVTALYVLDPTRVTPLVTFDGAVYYQLKRDDLSGLRDETVTVPASEIIHDTMIAPFHPLIGLTPLYASTLAVSQGLSIQGNSKSFFTNGSMPGGIILVPNDITPETASRLKATWETNYGGENIGRVAVLSNGMTYQATGFVNARDSQLIDQLKMSAEQICSAYGVPPYLVDIGPPPPYANFEPLLLKYHSQCIQSLTVNLEECLDVGLGLKEPIDGTQYGTEFDIDDLIWMDTDTRVKSAQAAISSGGMSPDEARKKYYGLGPVPGGDSPYLQEQNWPLRLLSERELPQRQPTQPAAMEPPASMTPDRVPRAAYYTALRRKLEGVLYAA